jgi:hypothetical protein
VASRRPRAVTGMACFNSRLTSLTTRTPPHADQPPITAGRRSRCNPQRIPSPGCVSISSNAGSASVDALGPAPRAELLHVLMLPDFERADRIGEFWSYPQSREFAELLIDCEEDRVLRAVLVGMLREMER